MLKLRGRAESFQRQFAEAKWVNGVQFRWLISISPLNWWVLTDGSLTVSNS